MSKSLFREGGPHRILKTGPDQYAFNISLPTDEYGRVARQCPNTLCSPGYFKVKPGTGITGGQQIAYCPYCRRQEEPNGFATSEQARYAKDIMMREAHKGIQDMLGDSIGIGPSGTRKFAGGMFSLEIKYQPGSLPHVHRPLEEGLFLKASG